MKPFLYVVFICFTLLSCKSQPEPTQFTTEALNDTFINLEGNKVTFQSILNQHKNKTIVIDVWASWCGDCIKGMPKVKALQMAYPQAEYVFLSLDKTVKAWKRGIGKYKVKGDHYFMQSGWKGDFATFLNLDWIPRYMVIDPNQNISVFNAITANDTKIIKRLTK